MGLKNIVRGNRAEAYFSKLYHHNSIPFLLSGLVLRSLGCGQVDVCYYDQNHIVILEVKNSKIAKHHVNQSIQGRRLRNAADLLSQVFNKNTRIISVAQKENFAKCRIPH